MLKEREEGRERGGEAGREGGREGDTSVMMMCYKHVDRISPPKILACCPDLVIYNQGWGQLQIGNYNYGINYRPNIIINYNYNYTVTAQVQLQLQLHQGGFQLCN